MAAASVVFFDHRVYGLHLDKKMSRGRFWELPRGSLCQAGLDVAAAQRATYNRLRRFVPTIANTMRLPGVGLAGGGELDGTTTRGEVTTPNWPKPKPWSRWTSTMQGAKQPGQL